MLIRIEISKGSRLKYEYDKEMNCLVLDRILHNTNVFPYNYGYIPKTLSPDGDPLDVILISEHCISPGTMVNCKPIGGIETEDEKGLDDKIIMVLENSIDPKSKFVNDIGDIGKATLEEIKYFLKHYKDNEKNKFIKIGNIYDKNEAIAKINKFKLKNF